MINDKEKEFIFSNLDSDLHKLILNKDQLLYSNPELIIDQIYARQKYKNKFPSLIENHEILFPKKIHLEQSSSENTAKHKFQDYKGELAYDLTCGFGIDTIELSKKFKKVISFETNEILIEKVRSNLRTLNIDNVELINGKVEDYIDAIKDCDLIYADPDRRNKGNRKILLQDYSPNIIDLKDHLLSKTKILLLKVSPMYDYHEAIRELPEISQIKTISIKNELKELLLELSNEKELTFYSMELFPFSSLIINSDRRCNPKKSVIKKYIYLPNVGLNKLEMSNTLAEMNSLFSIGSNLGIYTSDEKLIIDQFRTFKVISINNYSKKNNLLYDKYNIISKNTGISTKEIKNKLKIKEGGEEYLFLIKDDNKKYYLIEAKKIPTK